MIAGQVDHLALGQRLAQRLEERAGRLERLGEGKIAKLDDVSEQDQPLGIADLLDQEVPDRLLAEHILAGEAAEVQVGDDRGPHAAQPTRCGGSGRPRAAGRVRRGKVEICLRRKRAKRMRQVMCGV